MNRLMMRWPMMAEADNPGGGGNPPSATEPPKENPPPATEPPKENPPSATEPPKNADDKTLGPTGPKGGPGDKGVPGPGAEKPINLLDDPEGDDKQTPKEGEEAKPPTDEEQKAFRESIKAIDLGEGVKWDDPSLEAMTPELMRLTGNDPKKAEGIVKAYTAHQQAQVKAMQEQQDKFLNGLVGECKKRFGDDLGRMCALAKAGGRRIFGDEIWNVMRKEPSFANNPDIIEKLAAFGRSEKDDPGVTAAKPKAAGGDRDWRESMYGKK